MLHAALYGPWAETINIDALPYADGAVLMPSQRPILRLVLVEEDGPYCAAARSQSSSRDCADYAIKGEKGTKWLNAADANTGMLCWQVGYRLPKLGEAINQCSWEMLRSVFREAKTGLFLHRHASSYVERWVLATSAPGRKRTNGCWMLAERPLATI